MTQVDLDTSQIKDWRSIVTLIVFVLTNVIVLIPFHVPLYVPRPLWEALSAILSYLRVISPRQERPQHGGFSHDRNGKAKPSSFVKLGLPLNYVTAPLIADLFLLAILAIGRQEVHDGTIGADGISPLDIMLFFLSLAYIAISIDASGLIRYLAFRVLNWGGDNGYRLYFYLYTFFFCVASFIGNDPIILSGTAFIAYMTRVSRNIRHPRAWIHMQFTVANMGSAILVSSNPTNLVLAGAFDIKFIHYTANMVVPVIVTAIVLFPFLLYIIFRDEKLIPASIEIHELPVELRKGNKKALNPNIPHVRANLESTNNDPGTDEQDQLLSLEEIMNPFVDQFGAAFGAIIMATTLITLLALNAASTIHEVFWVTLPGAFVMLCWDLVFGWFHRQETRKIAKDGRRTLELAQAERAIEMEARRGSPEPEQGSSTAVIEPASTPMISPESQPSCQNGTIAHTANVDENRSQAIDDTDVRPPTLGGYSLRATSDVVNEKGEGGPVVASLPLHSPVSYPPQELPSPTCGEEIDEKKGDVNTKKPATLVSLVVEVYVWLQETFPTATTVVANLPFKLVPFAFSMFVLVQGLVTKGWVPVFAYGWDHWVNKTGTIGSIAGMGFLSAVLCNFAGTNIGTTILLSRVIQAWQQIHINNHTPITDRIFWATVYAMALGVNYGAFSAAFSASLAGLLWRDILARKHINVKSLDFARVNLPIIAIAMTVGCGVLVGEVYIMRGNSPYSGGGTS